jgi:oligoendopeptidase F
LMNYNGTVDNMFTLAHEMGHALHSFSSNSTQCYPKARYSIFVAEVASTLNEGLLLDYLLKKSTDTQQKLYLLNRSIDNTVGTFFNQIMYAHFEYLIHQQVEQGNALSPDLMTDMWRELTERYSGPELTVDEFTPLKWSRIPHFYNGYYVYQYATSYAASQAIMTKFLAGEAGIIDKYLTMLAAGGSDYPIELLKACGVDMTTPDPVQATLDLFARQVAEVEKLTS